jgi:ATP-dependent RNA helicase DDX21
MLDIGFADAMESIIKAVHEQTAAVATKQSSDAPVQTLLFSATLPHWVNQVTKKYLRQQELFTIDLVKDQQLKTNENIRQLAIQCPWQQRASTLADVIRVYGGGSGSGRTIVFTETKNEANELVQGASASLAELNAQVLHGDIAQKQRELTLAAFREGKCRVLVATDVAARGLDIPAVDLVVQCQPPKDPSTFVHRSGRTGRAGNKGICVLFYKAMEESLVAQITQRTGVKFERIGAPQVAQLLEAAGEDAIRELTRVHPSVVPHFLALSRQLIEGERLVPALEESIESRESRAEHLLAVCLAQISGHSRPPPQRSLLNSYEDHQTMAVRLTYPIRSVGYVRSILERQLPSIPRDSWKGMRMMRDMQGAAFDVESSLVEEALAEFERNCTSDSTRLELLTEMPDLLEREGHQQGYNQGGFGNNNNNGNNHRSGYGNNGSNGRGRGRGGYSRGGSYNRR